MVWMLPGFLLLTSSLLSLAGLRQDRGHARARLRCPQPLPLLSSFTTSFLVLCEEHVPPPPPRSPLPPPPPFPLPSSFLPPLLSSSIARACRGCHRCPQPPPLLSSFPTTFFVLCEEYAAQRAPEGEAAAQIVKRLPPGRQRKFATRRRGDAGLREQRTPQGPSVSKIGWRVTLRIWRLCLPCGLTEGHSRLP